MKKYLLIVLLLISAVSLNAQEWKKSLIRINELCTKYDPYIRTFFYNESTNNLKWVNQEGDITCEAELSKIYVTYDESGSYIKFNCRVSGSKCIACTYGGPTDLSSITVKDKSAALEIISELNKIAALKGLNLNISSSKISSALNAGFKYPSQYSSMVLTFLKLWVNKPSGWEDEMKNYISPAYMKLNNLSWDEYKVNCYYPSDCEVESTDEAMATVVANVWGEGRKWNHRMSFKIVTENGYLYFYPSKFSDVKYVTPWYDMPDKTESSPETRLSGGTARTIPGSSGIVNQYSTFVSGFLDLWVNRPTDANKQMGKYISLSYLRSKRLKIDDYNINTYYIYGFEIIKSDMSSGTVVANVWGEGKKWIHRITFKVVSESGRNYL